MATPVERQAARNARRIASQCRALADDFAAGRAVSQSMFGAVMDELTLTTHAATLEREADAIFTQEADDEEIELIARTLFEAAATGADGPAKPWGHPSHDKIANARRQSKHAYYRMLAGAVYAAQQEAKQG